MSNYVDNGEKFEINEYNTNFIDGLYINSYISNETIFDIETMKYESIDITRNIAINFFIHIDREIIEIWGNKTNSQKLIIRLGILFNNKIILDSINITIPDIISRRYTNNILIGKVKIEDVVLQDNLIAIRKELYNYYFTICYIIINPSNIYSIQLNYSLSLQNYSK